MLAAHMIEELNDAEENERDDNEVDDSVDERAPVNVDRLSEIDSLNTVLAYDGHLLQEGVYLAERVLAENESEHVIDKGLEDVVREMDCSTISQYRSF